MPTSAAFASRVGFSLPLRVLGLAVAILAVAFAWRVDPPAVRSADEWLRALTLEERIAQLLIVRFDGPAFSPAVATMIRRHGVGGVALYAKAGNIAGDRQLGWLIASMRAASAVPLAVVVDQEGGRVDRLEAVRGVRPSAAALAAEPDPVGAVDHAGREDARDLARLGFDVNLAPVVDVTRVYNWQLAERTFGSDAETVTRLAGAYLFGLQASGQVVGVLKHFPGLGTVAADPHRELPRLAQPRGELESVDWAPYRALIARGDVHAVMVTHAIVEAVDPTQPASLSAQVVAGVLRRELAFDGVILTDSLEMKGAGDAAPIGDRALAALLAGSDWLLGAASPEAVAAIIDRLARAVADGTLDGARIDESVRRVLALKVRVGLVE